MCDPCINELDYVQGCFDNSHEIRVLFHVIVFIFIFLRFVRNAGFVVYIRGPYGIFCFLKLHSGPMCSLSE